MIYLCRSNIRSFANLQFHRYPRCKAVPRTIVPRVNHPELRASRKKTSAYEIVSNEISSYKEQNRRVRNDRWHAADRVYTPVGRPYLRWNRLIWPFQWRNWNAWPPGRRAAAVTWWAVYITDTRPVTKIDTDASSTRRPARQCRVIYTELPWA